MSRTIVARVDADYGDPIEILVILDEGTPAHVALREKSWHGWSPPLDIVSDQTDEVKP